MSTDENEAAGVIDPPPENLRTVYQELCTSYRAIDDFRAKLLGFLPLATGTGIFLLLDKLKDVDNLKDGTKFLLTAVGVFGFFITLGLFAYEIYGIKKCCALIMAGQRMEVSLHIINGQFLNRPQNVASVINEPFAAGVIYPTVLAAWTFFALSFAYPIANPLIPICIFIVGFAGTLIYELILRKRIKNSGTCEKELKRELRKES